MLRDGSYSKSPKIVVIGGGTGNFALLQGLKEFTPNLTAIVSMSDDGGSTGKLRDELGVLPPGDIRQCLVALSDTPEIRDLFNYRFGKGSLAGQSLGNIILSGLELKYQNFAEAVRVAGSILHITGSVLPVTLDKNTLIMHDGKDLVTGEHQVGHHKIRSKEVTMTLKPSAQINPEAKLAIENADIVVVAPGNLYGTLLPAMLVEGLAQALSKTKAPLVMVSNLVTKPGQTDDWHVVDYVRELEKYIDDGQIDIVLYNTSAPTPQLLKHYALEGEYPVGCVRDRFNEIKAQPVGAELVASEILKQDENDKAIRRTLIRHDGRKVSEQLMSIYYNLARQGI